MGPRGYRAALVVSPRPIDNFAFLPISAVVRPPRPALASAWRCRRSVIGYARFFQLGAGVKFGEVPRIQQCLQPVDVRLALVAFRQPFDAHAGRILVFGIRPLLEPVFRDAKLACVLRIVLAKR
jgi:hypothetical protein